ncbi:MAG: lytic murein transglycosylase [Pseudomonadota bacterium]
MTDQTRERVAQFAAPPKTHTKAETRRAARKRGLARLVAAAGASVILGGSPSLAAPTAEGFREFVREFRGTALSRGVNPQVFDRAFDGVVLNEDVMRLDRRQPEFTKPIWEYLRVRLSNKFVDRGLEKKQINAEALANIEERYKVEKEVVAAIWGLESFYGANRGDIRVVEALATLAYEGRRRKFGKEQLLAALKIIQNGDTSPENMVGSWAGAMGHTQFIPTSYLALAVDYGGDGRRDIWSEDPTDALASTANYLTKNGWRMGEPWGFQVAIPAQFDYSRYAEARLSTDNWGAAGLTLASGGPLPAGYDGAELLLPAGALGPAFLVLGNYRALLRYNNATAYALAVALLSERLSDRPARVLTWPEDDRPLNGEERREMQSTLNELGFNAGPVDGILGGGSRRAIRNFQASNSMIADGYPSSRLLDDLRRALAAKSAPILRVAAGPASAEDVREIQALLNALGYRLTIDGKVGPRTQRAIQRFLDDRDVNLSAEASREVLAELRRAVRGG